jgi:hypothetical protein
VAVGESVDDVPKEIKMDLYVDSMKGRLEKLSELVEEQEINTERLNKMKSLLPDKKHFKVETALQMSVHKPKDEIDQALFNEQTGNMKGIKLKDHVVRNFNVYFLLRYVLFSTAIVALQHLQQFQAVAVFMMQMVYFVIFARIIVKKRIFKSWFPYLAFFVQESALSLFLFATLIHQFNKRSITDQQLFIIEICQISGIFIAFGVEALALIMVILSMVTSVLCWVAKKTCCKGKCKKKKKRTPQRKNSRRNSKRKS